MASFGMLNNIIISLNRCAFFCKVSLKTFLDTLALTQIDPVISISYTKVGRKVETCPGALPCARAPRCLQMKNREGFATCYMK